MQTTNKHQRCAAHTDCSIVCRSHSKLGKYIEMMSSLSIYELFGSFMLSRAPCLLLHFFMFHSISSPRYGELHAHTQAGARFLSIFFFSLTRIHRNPPHDRIHPKCICSHHPLFLIDGACIACDIYIMHT